jgi:hypothetical protein
MRDTELADQAAAAIINAAGESLSQEKREPGVLLPLIQALISVDAPEADELLALALERYGDDAFTASDVIRLQLSRAGAGEEHRRALQRAQVEVWIAHANKGDAFLKVHFLEGAVNLARDYGLTDLVDSITAEMQKVSIGDLDLKRHTYEIKLPGEAVEQFIGEFTDADSWQAAFARLSGYPPSGDAAKNREAAEEVAKGAPLFSILPMVSLGGDGLPRFTVSADDERREKRLVDYEMSSVRIYAPVMYTILIRIWEKWGPISAEELAVFLGQHRHVKPPLAAALARAFLRFFNGDSEATIFTATPRLEALVRELVLAGGLPIYRTQRARSPGQYPGLGVLLPALQKAGVDESWIRYLNGLLANPMGENARNELLHGFVDDPPETLAALVLVGVLFLTVGVSIDPPRE